MAVSRTLVWTWVVALLAFSGIAGLRAVKPAPPGAATARPIFDAASLGAAGAQAVAAIKAARLVPAAPPPVAHGPIDPLAPPAGPPLPAGAAGALRGLVTAADGRPLAGARILASGSAGSGAAVSDVDGAYLLALAPGLYRLHVEAPGFASGLELVRIAADRTSELNFALTAAQPPAGPPPGGQPTSAPPPPPTNAPAPGQVRGRVTGLGGQPIAGATVTAGAGGAVVASARANPQGEYVLVLRVGAYSLRASAPGYAPASAQAVVAARQQVTVDFALTPLDGPTATPGNPPTATPAPYPTPGPTQPPTPVGSVAGVVASAATGEPIAGAQVRLLAGGELVRQAVTDSQGRYAISGIPISYGDSYNIEALAAGYSLARTQVVVLSNQQSTVNFALAPAANPTPEPTQSPPTATPPGGPAPGTFVGMVSDSSTQAPIRGATIRAMAGGAVWTAVTDTQGRYSLTVPAGAYELQATAETYALRVAQAQVGAGETVTLDWWMWIDRNAPTPTATPFPTPTATPSEPTATPTPGPGTLTGFVVALDGSPIAGAEVWAMNGGTSSSALTDLYGRYGLSLAAGSYSVVVTADGFQQSRGQVQMGAGQTMTVDFTLAPLTTPTATPTFPGPNTGTLTGVVTALNGPPIAGAEVRAMAAGVALNVFTDSQGRYDLVLPIGDYRIDVVATGYSRYRSSVVINYGQTVTKDWALFPLATPTATPTPVVSPGTSALFGVISGGGGPIAGATVRATGGGAAWSAVTDSQGRYSLRVPSGSYVVEATAPGFQRAQAQAQVPAGQSVIVDLTLPASANQPRPAGTALRLARQAMAF